MKTANVTPPVISTLCIIMANFFNIKIKETNDLMRDELKAILVPFLKERGFSGKLPQFRRQTEQQCQLLEIQFDRYGRRFAVNLSIVSKCDNFLKAPRTQLDELRTQRLGTRKKRMQKSWNMDHWFVFLKGFIFYRPSYSSVSQEVIELFEEEADQIFSDLQKALDTGVECIHLK